MTDVFWLVGALLVLGILLALWANRMDRTLRSRSDELEKLIKAVANEVETVHDVAFRTVSLEKELNAKLQDLVVALAVLSEQPRASHRAGRTPDTLQEPALAEEGVGSVSAPEETATQMRAEEGVGSVSAPEETARQIPPLDVAAARSLFAELRSDGLEDTPGVTQLRLNWIGRSEEASNSDPPHIFKTVRQVGDFVAFSTDLRTALLFPNPEAGETSADLEFVFPAVKQGDFQNALENLMPLQIELRDNGSWVSIG